MELIHFFSEEINYNLKNKTKIRSWLKQVIHHNKRTITALNYIFTSDEHLLKINQNYLKHNSYTDIITFDHSTESDKIESDIFISIDRVRENAANNKTSFSEELHRVMIHGVLHLLGCKDKSDSEKNEMRKKENHYLNLRFN